MNERVLYPCSKTPTLDEPAGCIDEIAQHYQYVKQLGKGSAGTVIQVAQTQAQAHRRLAVKILPLTEEAIHEVQTQCLLNDLQRETGLFAHVYGWQVCNGLPAPWARRVKKKGSLLFIFMEETLERWTDADALGITPDERKAVLFLLLHGLYVGRRELGFDHSDLHRDNIMLQLKDEEKEVSVTVGARAFSVGMGARFVPKLIDYGYSQTKFDAEESDESADELFEREASSTDLSSLSEIFPELKKIPGGKDAIYAPASDSAALEKMLLSPYFEEYRVTQKENTINARCLVCQVPATHQLKHNPTKTFCGEPCAARFWF